MDVKIEELYSRSRVSLTMSSWLAAVCALLAASATLTAAKMTENREQSRELQRGLGQDHVTIVVDGILERLLGEPSPDPLVLINFPDLNTQFKVHVLEDSRTIKITLAMDDGKDKCG